MRIRKKTLYLWSFASLIGILAFFSFQSGASNGTGNAVDHSMLTAGNSRVGLDPGNQAPDFTVTSIDGAQISLSDYAAAGKPVVLYFTASWCPNCKRDLSAATPVYQQQHADAVDVLVVSLERNDDEDVLSRYQAAYAPSFTFAMGNPDVLRAYSVRYTTTKFAINKDGIITSKNIGILNGPQWQSFFQEALA